MTVGQKYSLTQLANRTFPTHILYWEVHFTRQTMGKISSGWKPQLHWRAKLSKYTTINYPSIRRTAYHINASFVVCIYAVHVNAMPCILDFSRTVFKSHNCETFCFIKPMQTQVWKWFKNKEKPKPVMEIRDVHSVHLCPDPMVCKGACPPSLPSTCACACPLKHRRDSVPQQMSL